MTKTIAVSFQNSRQNSRPALAWSISPKDITIGQICTRVLVSVTTDWVLHVWCTSTGLELQSIQAPISGGSNEDYNNQSKDSSSAVLAWSSDGSLITLATHQGSVHVWSTILALEASSNSQTNEPSKNIDTKSVAQIVTGLRRSFTQEKQNAAISYLQFTPDNHHLVCGSMDGSYTVVSLATGQQLVRFNSSSAKMQLGTTCSLAPYAVAIGSETNPELLLLATISKDGRGCTLWDVFQGRNHLDISYDAGGPITNCGGFFELSRPKNRGNIPISPIKTASNVPILVTAHSTTTLGRQEGRICFYDVYRKQRGWVDNVLVAPMLSIDNIGGRVTSIDTGVDAETNSPLLAASSTDNMVTVWEFEGSCDIDVQKPRALFTIDLTEDIRSSAPNQAVHMDESPLWQTAARSHASNAYNIVIIKFSPDFAHLAVATSFGNVAIYEVDSGEMVWSTKAYSGRIRHMELFNSGGVQKLLTIGSDNNNDKNQIEAKVWRPNI